jgi:hypothetical protein
MYVPAFLSCYLTGGSNPRFLSCILVISSLSGGEKRILHAVPETHDIEDEVSNRGGKTKIHRERGIRERSHRKLGELYIEEPIEKALKDVLDQIRSHVQTTLNGAGRCPRLGPSNAFRDDGMLRDMD